MNIKKYVIIRILLCISYSIIFSEEINFTEQIDYQLIDNYKIKSETFNFVINQYNNEYLMLYNTLTDKTVKLQVLNFGHINNAVFLDKNEVVLSYGGNNLKDTKYITNFNTITGEQIWSYKISGDFYIDDLYVYNNTIITGCINSGIILILDIHGKVLKKIKICQYLYWLSPTKDGQILSFGSKNYSNSNFSLFCCDLNGKNISSFSSFTYTSGFAVNNNSNLFLQYDTNSVNNELNKVDIYDLLNKQKILTLTPYLPVRTASFSIDGKYVYVISGRYNFVFEKYDLSGNKVLSNDIHILKKYYIPNKIILNSNSITVLEENFGP